MKITFNLTMYTWPVWFVLHSIPQKFVLASLKTIVEHIASNSLTTKLKYLGKDKIT